jgi:hypothetical protein
MGCLLGSVIAMTRNLYVRGFLYFESQSLGGVLTVCEEELAECGNPEKIGNLAMFFQDVMVRYRSLSAYAPYLLVVVGPAKWNGEAEWMDFRPATKTIHMTRRALPRLGDMFTKFSFVHEICHMIHMSYLNALDNVLIEQTFEKLRHRLGNVYAGKNQFEFFAEACAQRITGFKTYLEQDYTLTKDLCQLAPDVCAIVDQW